ncbi:minor capsid protein [Levilactobacillus hammesii]|uniref:Phage head morphogenesis domain-containing protein n=1 Tax=Levilactobacillus hammesii DSM 16381 TaxID=1423753 RepID=A0A0R1UV87_9LACO|nr:minor capsid protein [Levilactobacillus hammesii]KRL95562.1 hypothetical protein FD28_GL002534 [Levilactobacillus hammesii DSM 16381]
MTKLSYWERRHLQTKAREIKSTEAYEKALQPELNGLYRELHAEMEKWYTRYANTEGIDKDEAKKTMTGINTKHWQLTLKQFEERAKSGGYQDQLDAEYFRSRVARLQDLEQQLRQLTQSFANHRTEVMRDALADQYDDTYMRTTYNIQAQKGSFTANFAHFNEAQLLIAASQPWGKDGKDFSKRIWKNYQQELPSYLMDTVLRGTVLGWSPQKVTQMFYARFQDVKRNDIHRLVVSEMGHVAEEASFQSYEENEIEQYEYMATLESHTCDICGHLDGQIFRTDKRIVGINYPLIHARCRCTTAPYIKDLPDLTERWSRDPETDKGKMIKDVKFNEWKQMINQERIGRSLPSHANRAAQNSKGYLWNEPNAEQYNKHVSGTPEFINYEKGRGTPVSQLILSIDEAAEVINVFGRQHEDDDANKILFTSEDYIGLWADINGDLYPTKKGRISYRKRRGAHITPMKPDYLK